MIGPVLRTVNQTMAQMAHTCLLYLPSSSRIHLLSMFMDTRRILTSLFPYVVKFLTGLFVVLNADDRGVLTFGGLVGGV